jgi:hypothetical protein
MIKQIFLIISKTHSKIHHQVRYLNYPLLANYSIILTTQIIIFPYQRKITFTFWNVKTINTMLVRPTKSFERINQHLAGGASAWTLLYKPINLIEYKEGDNFEEDKQ